MQPCILCNQNAVREIELYIKGEKHRYTICAKCVAAVLKKERTNLFFFAAMLICWLMPIQNGFMSFSGILGTIIGLYGFARLILLVAARVYLRFGNDIPDWIWKGAMGKLYAQEAVADQLKRELNEQYVQTPREFERNPFNPSAN
ncbi:hypothetical protein ACRQU7_14845 [Caproiciproducens sp. R1]|uniref:hypothetical protein n=1 Tax=Caproiciproducens sp. R1 TaxID=3435000 RepID=UPI0040337CB5